MSSDLLGAEAAPVARERRPTPALGAIDLAGFCVDGFLLLDGVVDGGLDELALAELRAYRGHKNRLWAASEVIRSVFDVAEVRDAVRLLAGTSSYDHSSVHLTPAGFPFAQPWHQDSMVEVRPLAFDLLALYFPADTPAEMGPTLVLPGSHLRRVSNRSLARHHSFRGQRLLSCSAGSVAVLHAGLWHCAQPNRTDVDRYMFKLRLRPGPDQANAASSIGQPTAEVLHRFLAGEHPWQGTEAGVDQVGYAALWSYLGGSGDVSPEGYLTRTGLLGRADPTGTARA